MIERWAAAAWEWAAAAGIMWDHIRAERERNAPETGTPENPVVGVVVEDAKELPSRV